MISNRLANPAFRGVAFWLTGSEKESLSKAIPNRLNWPSPGHLPAPHKGIRAGWETNSQRARPPTSPKAACPAHQPYPSPSATWRRPIKISLFNFSTLSGRIEHRTAFLLPCLCTSGHFFFPDMQNYQGVIHRGQFVSSRWGVSQFLDSGFDGARRCTDAHKACAPVRLQHSE